jgi:hypothetical protein
VEHHSGDEGGPSGNTFSGKSAKAIANNGEMMMNELLNIKPTEKALTPELIATSERFPNTEVIYGKGLWLCPKTILADAEKCLGYRFPHQLRLFYLEVGVGRLPGYTHTAYNSPNNILIPTHIPRLIDGTCEWMMPYTQIEPETLPFFERDVDLFLCLHPKSDNPNAVYWMWGEKICDSLVEFFQKLVEDPDWFNPPKP